MNICKTKTLRTNQLFVQDNYKSLLQTTKRRFERLTSIAKKRHPNTFSYVPASHHTRQPPHHSLQQQQYQLQMQQKQAQHDAFMARFANSAATGGNTSLSGQLLSNTVANAANAVAVACKQQQQQQQHQHQNVLIDATIGFKTPRYLVELKILKEKQAKLPPVPPSQPITMQPPVQTTQPSILGVTASGATVVTTTTTSTTIPGGVQQTNVVPVIVPVQVVETTSSTSSASAVGAAAQSQQATVQVQVLHPQQHNLEQSKQIIQNMQNKLHQQQQMQQQVVNVTLKLFFKFIYSIKE